MVEREPVGGDDPGILSGPGEGRSDGSPDLGREKAPKSSKDSCRTIAATLIGIGVGTIVGSRFTTNETSLTAGAVILGVGLTFLFISKG